ncbi:MULTISPECIES: DUF4377 domain-containing protein [unclassified Psychrobacter]|uniref:DUF4377 domain-containing protein n=1 Tax=unclassified Psychrobacter TaxID=196806 RepID=UPI001889A309|nr:MULTISPECIES: DUF4377 domain-containing protein [unclassified Psychrobacter]MBF2718548.1 hypothetical protein [Psychrobacter sp. NG254]MBH0005882.1 hypothetical protein [Psychrobacter sp. SWN149]MBI0425408.1 hypothetical protein [Psychrobacter sp. NG27]
MISFYQSSKAPLLLAGLLSATALLSACQTSPFAKDPVPEPRYIPSVVLGEAQTLTIMPNRVACESALPMQCLLAKSRDGSVFQIPYDWIDDFAPSLGTEYVISARPQIDEGQQSATGHWTLQNILSQRMVGTI